nr:hypothetical protein [Tanacetum cinerariifolium]
MAEQQTIKYAPQGNNITVDNSTDVAYDPFSSTDETEQGPLKKFLIKFSVLNGQRPLTLDFNTFCSSTGLDYNNGKYVAHSTLEAVKKESGKISTNLSYLDKTSILKNSFPLDWKILFTFVIQILNGNNYSTKQVNSIQQLLAYCLVTGTEDEKFGFLPGIPSHLNFTKDPSKITDIKLTALMITINNQRDSVSLLLLATKPKKGKSLTVTPALPKSQVPEASGALFRKRQKPMSKKPPTETKVILAFLKELIFKVLGLLVSLLELNRFGILIGELEEGQFGYENLISPGYISFSFNTGYKAYPKRRAKEYMWTMTNRIKPEPITDVKIHPNTKPEYSIYKKNDKRNFDVHNPFKFTDFKIAELDELGPIIQKKNYILKDLMTSLSKRYERLNKIPEELRIQSALPAPVPEQASS